MDGLTIGLAVGGIVIGAVASYIVSNHFFKKGVKEKSLVPYIQFRSKLFTELDDELKDNLVVNYKTHKIENITQAQFLIANSGDIPIRDIIEPLKLVLPKSNKVFSANIIHIEPEGRSIDHKVIETDETNIVQFNIPLLNGGEFFVVKLLIQDSLVNEIDGEKLESPFKFTITADDLPPELEVSRLPYSFYEDQKEKGYDWTWFWIGIISSVLSTSIIGTIFSLKYKVEGLYLFSFSEFFNWETFGFLNVCILLLAVLGFLTLIVSIMSLIGAISDIKPSKKQKIKVPNKLRKEREWYPVDFFD